jgi:hypothetical protein
MPQERLSNLISRQEIAQRSNIEGPTRLFRPSEVDLDALAEAIRSLLGPTNVPQIDAPSRPNPNLRSSRRRGSHVLEAPETL